MMTFSPFVYGFIAGFFSAFLFALVAVSIDHWLCTWKNGTSRQRDLEKLNLAEHRHIILRLTELQDSLPKKDAP